jgi:NADH dehydrogenase
MQNLVIVGGGFAGTWAAMSAAATRATLARADMTISVVSASTHLCIRPRLYEGADPSMLVPLRPLMDEIDVGLIHDSVEAVDGQTVSLRGGGNMAFDALVFAAGSAVNLPACDGAAQHGFVVDDYDSTRRLDAHLATLDSTQDSDRTIVVIGSSFSGIEIITKLRQRVGDAFRLVLIDRNNWPSGSMGDALHDPVSRALDAAQVEFWPNRSPEAVTQSSLRVTGGDEIPSRTVIFATGFRANGLTTMVSSNQDETGRVVVDEMLRIAGNHMVFAAGDVASASADGYHRAVMSCQHAMPMGIAAGRNAVLAVAGSELVPYAQPFYATCIDLGGSGAVFTNGWERSIVMSGAQGAEMKQQINTQWIYPPDPSVGRQKIFEFIQNA